MLIFCTYIYNAWGRFLGAYNSSGNTITSATNIALVNPLRYRGYYYDTETGFYYLGSRYYDPQMYRFLNADTAGLLVTSPMSINNKNLFSYCNDNPVCMKDVNGNFAILTSILIVAGVTLAASLASGIVSSCTGGTFEGGAINGALSTVAVAGAVVTGVATGPLLAIGAVSGYIGYSAQCHYEHKPVNDTAALFSMGSGLAGAGISSAFASVSSGVTNSLSSDFAENVTFAYVTNLSTNTVSTVTSAAFSIHNSSSNYYNGKNDGKKGGGGIYSNHTLCF